MKKIYILFGALVVALGLYAVKTTANTTVTKSDACRYAQGTTWGCIKCMYSDPHDPCHKSCPGIPV